jgi:hypothetical protein
MEQGNNVVFLEYIGLDGNNWVDNLSPVTAQAFGLLGGSDPHWNHRRTLPTPDVYDSNWIGYYSPDNGHAYASVPHAVGMGVAGDDGFKITFDHYRVTSLWQAQHNPTADNPVHESTTEYVDFIAPDGTGWRAQPNHIPVGGGNVTFIVTQIATVPRVPLV